MSAPNEELQYDAKSRSPTVDTQYHTKIQDLFSFTHFVVSLVMFLLKPFIYSFDIDFQPEPETNYTKPKTNLKYVPLLMLTRDSRGEHIH